MSAQPIHWTAVLGLPLAASQSTILRCLRAKLRAFHHDPNLWGEPLLEANALYRQAAQDALDSRAPLPLGQDYFNWCPFCGKDGAMLFCQMMSVGHYVKCTDEGCLAQPQTRCYDTPAQARQAWNLRP